MLGETIRLPFWGWRPVFFLQLGLKKARVNPHKHDIMMHTLATPTYRNQQISSKEVFGTTIFPTFFQVGGWETIPFQTKVPASPEFFLGTKKKCGEKLWEIRVVTFTSWWFQIFFLVSPLKLGNDPI